MASTMFTYDFRFAVAWLAAWCQVIVVAAMPLGSFARGLDPLGSVPICHAKTDNGQTPPSQPTHGDDQCVLCAICQSQGVSAILISSASVPTTRQFVVLVRFSDAQPRAPPPWPAIAAQPHGPPSLI